VPGAPTLVALALGAAIVAMVALAVLRRRRRRRAPGRLRRSAPRYPVVLAHGLLGFDEIKVGGRSHDYFRGVRARLAADGADVHRPRVAPSAGIASRAEELAAFIRALPDRRVNVVAHSMGGLDARYAITRLGLGRKVASLTTVGTPHLGTPIADLGAGLVGRARLLDALAAVGLDVAALGDLTTARMAAFNEAVPDRRGVAYGSVVGVAPGIRELNPLLVPTWLWLSERAGESDGVVPAASQRWGEVVRTIPADHWAQIGWSKAFDAVEFYAELLRELRARGF
jgi:triacylglycerol lipase